ncbi:hypothetical protein GCM10017673_37310 [Streptosporangium violaceochromogenes]|nr:hypothetical protein GCM10017673_37310 [Streptosporangium violaceochromogenes]
MAVPPEAPPDRTARPSMGTSMKTTFIGRSVEITQVIRLLRESRLVTLTGLGGVGKTRLARRVAEELSGEFPGGLWQVELACLTDPRLLPEAVADSMGMADQSARPQAEVLAEWLSARRALLMLDTCEHLVDAVASLVDTLLRRAPVLRVLATGRQPLGVSGEHLYPVPPLPVEDAVALLRDRAGLGGAGETPGDAGEGELAEICRRLDCVPLAIELAAVRLRAVPPGRLTRELDDRYHLLTGGDGPARHESLRATMGWSHELCTPAERLLWARLSVFGSCFDLEAAEQVCAGGPLPPEQVLEALTGLVEKSLVRREEHPTGVRLDMLDTVREFGAEWLLLLGEGGTVRNRYRDYYLRLARRCATEWSGRQVEWYARMRAEHRNLRRAFEICLADPGWSRVGVDLAGSLWFLWVCCGMLREGRHCLEAALRSETGSGPERIKALWVCAWVTLLQGDLDAARELLARCRAEDTAETAAGYVLQMEGLLALMRRDFPRAATLFEQAVTWHAARGDVPAGLLPCHTMAALSLLAAGRPEETTRILAEGRDLCEAYGEEWNRAQMEYVSAWAEQVRGDIPGALAHARASLIGARLFADLSLTVACVELIAWTAAETPGTAAARGAALLLGAAQAVWDSSGLPQFRSPILIMIRQRAVTRAVRTLGGGEFDTHFLRGKSLDLGVAVKYALEEENS